MIFNEVYGSYYRTVAKILAAAVDGRLDEKTMRRIVRESAFSESMLDIVPALRNETWKLIDKAYRTPLRFAPDMPLTTLEKRFLKTVSLDPRFALFDVPASEIPDVEPLFLPEDIVYFDRFGDGDPYTDETYIRHFRMVWRALREQRMLRLTHKSASGETIERTCFPFRMTYSDRDDKFRVDVLENGRVSTVNLARIKQAALPDTADPEARRIPDREERETMILEFVDERNLLERLLLQLSHYRKRVEPLADNAYRLELAFDPQDERDLLIQILSFGPFVRLLSPARMAEEIRQRVVCQERLFAG